MRIVTARCLIAMLGLVLRPLGATGLTGAGSTFVYPLVAQWAVAYARDTGVEVNYQSIGSGGGQKQIENATVDFGATDVPLELDRLRELALDQFPLVAGAVVPVIHLRSVPDRTLKLSGEILADIFLGVIKRWNDPRLRHLNPELNLPDRLITVVHRADGSGTSQVFTSYLAAVSPRWRTEVGAATSVTWPTGVGAKGNEGVAAFVKLTEGAIGYVESAVATKARLGTARLENKAGAFVAADDDAFRAAVAAVDWTARPAFAVSLVNAPGAASWPIAGATFVLLRTKGFDQAVRNRALDFFRWAFARGGPAAESLHYVPLPATVRTRVTSAWDGPKG